MFVQSQPRVGRSSAGLMGSQQSARSWMVVVHLRHRHRGDPRLPLLGRRRSKASLRADRFGRPWWALQPLQAGKAASHLSGGRHADARPDGVGTWPHG